ncbi:hypothetical protein J4Q44_G00176250 [Coregonus suidteri]|uniref:Uncharacterized protein n=1 Tax=Coregonus suidteri TaxID=861788 RepID=A0AAN8QUP6_9TELE
MVMFNLISKPKLIIVFPIGNHQHSHLDLTQAHTPKIAHRQMRHEKPHRMNNILTSQTEPYDLDMSFSRSFQNLTHLPPNYELAAMSKADLSDKDVDEYYMRKRHQDLAGRQTLQPPHMVKLNAEPHQQQRQRPQPRPEGHVPGPCAVPREGPHATATASQPTTWACLPTAAASSQRSSCFPQDRLQSQGPPALAGQDAVAAALQLPGEKAMSRAMSHVDINFVPTTPVMDRSPSATLRCKRCTPIPLPSTDSYKHAPPSQPPDHQQEAAVCLATDTHGGPSAVVTSQATSTTTSTARPVRMR